MIKYKRASNKKKLPLYRRGQIGIGCYIILWLDRVKITHGAVIGLDFFFKKKRPGTIC